MEGLSERWLRILRDHFRAKSATNRLLVTASTFLPNTMMVDAIRALTKRLRHSLPSSKITIGSASCVDRSVYHLNRERINITMDY